MRVSQANKTNARRVSCTRGICIGLCICGNVSKSFIYCNIVKPVYNSHPLLTKATENCGKLSGDRNIQGDRFRAVTYRFMQR